MLVARFGPFGASLLGNDGDVQAGSHGLAHNGPSLTRKSEYIVVRMPILCLYANCVTKDYYLPLNQAAFST